ncbi:MAG: GNAT family N-acetyltransferase [Fimbriimonas sp.]|nr:GNAT family N-acetyltransferase [Fimbriimonas sp.]
MSRVAGNAWRFAYAGILPQEFIDSVIEPILCEERFRTAIRERPVARFVALSEDGQVVGFVTECRPCSLEGYDAEIGSLYVDPEASRSGIGAKLVDAMVARFKAQGCRSMAIHTLAQNRIGCAFYAKIGGQEGPIAIWKGVPSKWYVWPDLSRWDG